VEADADADGDDVELIESLAFVLLDEEPLQALTESATATIPTAALTAVFVAFMEVPFLLWTVTSTFETKGNPDHL